MADEKSKTGRQLDATGETVRKNIRRVRDARGISGAELSATVSQLGRPIPVLGIQRIEAGTRRVDVDDLMAIAVALEVSPATLLMPAVDPDELVAVTGQPLETPAGYLWGWLRADNPLPRPGDCIPNHVDGVERGGIPRFSADFLSRSLPPWRFAELEAEWARTQQRHGEPDGDDR